MPTKSPTLEESLQQALGLQPPWSVGTVEFDQPARRFEIGLRHDGPPRCPVCGREAELRDAPRRRWRHLDIFEYQAWLTAEVPRVKCPEHGMQEVPAPRPKERSGRAR